MHLPGRRSLIPSVIAMKLSAQAVKWMPTPGAMASFVGRSGRGRRTVRILAEAVAGRMYVEAVGRQGANVKFTVKRENLVQPQPDLFD